MTHDDEAKIQIVLFRISLGRWQATIEGGSRPPVVYAPGHENVIAEAFRYLKRARGCDLIVEKRDENTRRYVKRPCDEPSDWVRSDSNGTALCWRHKNPDDHVRAWPGSFVRVIDYPPGHVFPQEEPQ